MGGGSTSLPCKALRAWRLLGSCLRYLVVLAAMASAIGLLWLRQVTADLPQDLSFLRQRRPPLACEILADDGTVIDRFYDERRIWVDVDDLPEFVVQAFVAAEDRRYFDHRGVDIWAVLRALRRNFKSERIVEGGSTISQQLIKNMLGDSELSYRRKVREAVLARRLERALSKHEIIELYLNQIFLGEGNFGVEAAARSYFGVPARALDIPQAALLAGLTASPNRFSPRQNPAAALSRRNRVLRLMAKSGYLSPRAADLYSMFPLALSLPHESDRQPFAAGYATHVRREVRRLFGETFAFERGLRVQTALNRRIQEVAEAAVREGVWAVEQRQGARAATAHWKPEDWPRFLQAGPGLIRDEEGRLEEPRVGQCFSVLVGPHGDLDRLRAGNWTFSLQPSERGLDVRAWDGSGRPGPLEKRVRPGDVLSVCKTAVEGQVTRQRRPFAEGAAVVLENANGNVVAMVGGFEDSIEGYVRATQARRQAGSSFKPYVYATALEGGLSQIDTVLDAPVTVAGASGRSWRPRNYKNRYRGKIPLWQALAISSNAATVRLALRVGRRAIAERAHAMGIRSPLAKNLTVALGSSDVTPLEQAAGFSTIARGGVPIEPVFITSVRDSLGTELGRAGGLVETGTGGAVRLPGGEGAPALRPAVAHELADMMRDVVASGTGRRAQAPGLYRAGKTGTTDNFVDAWFIGFTPDHTIAVWIGTDASTTLGGSESGGRAALPVWIRIAQALPQVPGKRPPIPDDAMLVWNRGAWRSFPRGEVPGSVLPRPRRETTPLLPPSPGDVDGSTAGMPISAGASIASELLPRLVEQSWALPTLVELRSSMHEATLALWRADVLRKEVAVAQNSLAAMWAALETGPTQASGHERIRELRAVLPEYRSANQVAQIRVLRAQAIARARTVRPLLGDRQQQDMARLLGRASRHRVDYMEMRAWQQIHLPSRHHHREQGP